jgi:hypothetical protein
MNRNLVHGRMIAESGNVPHCLLPTKALVLSPLVPARHLRSKPGGLLKDPEMELLGEMGVLNE